MPRSLRVPAVPHYLALMRQSLGLTQAQLAGTLGLSRQFITQVEAGERVLLASAGLLIGWERPCTPQPRPGPTFRKPASRRTAPPAGPRRRGCLRDAAADPVAGPCRPGHSLAAGSPALHRLLAARLAGLQAEAAALAAEQ
jgi:hypothetical protein